MKTTVTAICIFFLFNIYSNALTNESQDISTASYNYDHFYIGTNPISYIAGLQLEDNLKRYIPLVTGLEYGFSLIGGVFIIPKLSIEGRLSMGNIHQLSRVMQFHLGTNYFIFRNSIKWYRNFYSGTFLKFWDYYNRLTEIHFYNIAPYIAIGYLFEINPIILDIRINQTFSVYSWSNLEHSSPGMDWFFSPWPQFIPVMPSLTFSIAYKF